MKYLELHKDGQLTLKDGVYKVYGYIELTDGKPESLVKEIMNQFGFDKDLAEMMALDSEFTVKQGSVVLFLQDGEAQSFSLEEAQRIDSLM